MTTRYTYKIGKCLLVAFLFLLTRYQSSAQITVTNDGKDLYVAATGTITINGNYRNQTNVSPGTIENAGTIALTGNWTNNSANGVFSTGAGTVQLNGSTAAQAIGGSNATDFYNLTLNNTYGTSPQITLGTSTNISNIFTMTTGNIDLATYMLTLGTSTANIGTLSHASGLIYGGDFKRWFAASTIADGNVAGLFPTGNPTENYRPVFISTPVTAPTMGGTIMVSHTNSNAVSNVSFADGASTVVRRHDAYWTVTSADGLAGGTYNIRTEGTGLGEIGDVNDLRLTLIGSVVGSAGVNAGTISNPQVNRTGLTLAQLNNNFYIGSVNGPNSPLPVELLDFDAKINGEAVDITWATTTEINNDYFTIEASPNPSEGEESWRVVGTVKGAGNSSSMQQYSLTDPTPPFGRGQGWAYYRLKQTDYDGKYKYSELASVEFMNDNIIVEIYYDLGIVVKLSGLKGEPGKIIVSDILGREYYSKTIVANDNDNTLIKINENLPNAVYLVVFITDKKINSKKIIIE